MTGRAMTDSVTNQHILRMVTSGAAASRADLVRELGLAASTVSLRVQELVAAGLLTESGEGASRGGRRPRLLRIPQQGGVALTADLGSHHGRLAAVGVDGTVSDAADHSHDLTAGPDQAVDWLVEQLAALAGQQRAAGRTVRSVGIAFPGPVDVATGRVLTPSRMPGWHNFPLRDVLADRLGLPVVVDNDATLMAVGEHQSARPELDHLVVVKAKPRHRLRSDLGGPPAPRRQRLRGRHQPCPGGRRGGTPVQLREHRLPGDGGQRRGRTA